LLPVEDYFIGANLPPHISPFVTERPGDYIPPERQLLLALERGEPLPGMIQMFFEIANYLIHNKKIFNRA